MSDGVVEDDQDGPSENRVITYDKVSSEVMTFTRGEVLDGSSGNSLIEQDDLMALCQSNNMPLTRSSQITQYSWERVNLEKEEGREEEEEEKEVEEEELFECQLGANGQVVLWSSQRETVLSRFDFVYPSCKSINGLNENMTVTLDDDGDPQVVRKNHLNKKEDVLLIEHQSATTLDLVGEQVWCGALYLADFILHNPNIFKDMHILELASGVGLTSIVASMFAKQVIVTDIERGEILQLIERNIKRNAHLVSADIKVKVIDFMKPSTIDDIHDSLTDVSILLAADVIYSNPLTDAFINTVLRLMSEPPNKTLYMAMEKRYVFTMEDMDSVAPCYEHLLTRLDWLRSQNLSRVEWTMELLHAPCEQYFTYERNKHLIIWKIQSKLKSTEK